MLNNKGFDLWADDYDKSVNAAWLGKIAKLYLRFYVKNNS
jgi:hypothetical protein